MAFHNDLGARGEQIATEYLIRKGFRILERNWRYYKAEIDIIAIDNNELVIVEVKTRSVHYHADTDDLIGKRKLLQLYEAADRFVEVRNMEQEVRYDLVTVVIHGETWTIEHIPDAFYPFMSG